jgi:lipoate-protein ligase A
MMNTAYPPAEWRLLKTGARDGATNMAIDEAILEAVAAGRVPPTLRFYDWDPPCLSLGFSQEAGTVDREACARRNWEIVRRPTGGQAILHVDELTYSVCAPLNEPRVAGGIVESYGRLAAGLLAGLKLIGLQPAEARPDYPGRPGTPGPVCFDGPARYEITLTATGPAGELIPRKLLGSAQSRRLGGVLQHGTLPLHGDITRIVDALNHAGPAEREAARAQLQGRALTLETALGRSISFEEMVETMAVGFESALNLQLVPGELTAAEREAVERIRSEKYGDDEWTFRR